MEVLAVVRGVEPSLFATAALTARDLLYRLGFERIASMSREELEVEARESYERVCGGQA